MTYRLPRSIARSNATLCRRRPVKKVATGLQRRNVPVIAAIVCDRPTRRKAVKMNVM